MSSKEDAAARKRASRQAMKERALKEEKEAVAARKRASREQMKEKGLLSLHVSVEPSTLRVLRCVAKEYKITVPEVITDLVRAVAPGAPNRTCFAEWEEQMDVTLENLPGDVHAYLSAGGGVKLDVLGDRLPLSAGGCLEWLVLHHCVRVGNTHPWTPGTLKYTHPASHDQGHLWVIPPMVVIADSDEQMAHQIEKYEIRAMKHAHARLPWSQRPSLIRRDINELLIESARKKAMKAARKLAEAKPTKMQEFNPRDPDSKFAPPVEGAAPAKDYSEHFKPS